MSASLSCLAQAAAATADPILRQPPEERDLRPLFQRAAQLIGTDVSEPSAITVYAADGTPLAWAGRPSELTGGQRGGVAQGFDRISGPAALFVAPGPLGFRLVKLQPLNAGGGRTPTRLGVVAAERLFSEQATVGNASSERFSIETSLAPVSLRTRYEGAGEHVRPFSFVIWSPSGELLVEASVDPASLV